MSKNQTAKSRPLVVLLSDSILMEGLGVSLREELGMHVIQIGNHRTDLQQNLDALEPDLIIIDLDDPQLPAILFMLRKQPGSLFLGIDLQFSQVVVSNCNRYPIHSMGEFCQLAETLIEGNSHRQAGAEPSDTNTNQPLRDLREAAQFGQEQSSGLD